MYYTAEELQEILSKMQVASNLFYAQATQIGVHGFIEFCGLMNEYIKLCEEAHLRGIDFTQANKHGSMHLPFAPHHISYLNEKLECIYGVEFVVKTENPTTPQRRHEDVDGDVYVEAVARGFLP